MMRFDHLTAIGRVRGDQLCELEGLVEEPRRDDAVYEAELVGSVGRRSAPRSGRAPGRSRAGAAGAAG